MKKILIIDDDEWFAECLKSAVSNKYEVFIAPHGFAALDILDSRKIDFMIIDLFLPGPNGLSILSEIKTYDDTAEIPIVIWSSMPEKIDKVALRKYGVIDIVDKANFKVRNLVDLVNHTLEALA